VRRGYRLWIPANCVTAQTRERSHTALLAVRNFAADTELRAYRLHNQETISNSGFPRGVACL
jgi:hypothetical protein